MLAVGGLLVTTPAWAEKIPSDKALLPEGEQARVGEHVVDAAAIKYRPGKGLAITSTDKAFSLVTRLRLQTLLTVDKENSEDVETGIMLRRARLQFAGHVFGEHNKFKTEFAFSPRDLSFTSIDGNTFPRETPLLSWYVELDHLRDLTVRFGQYKIPFSRQRLVSSGDLQMVDRAIANGEFNLDRDIGVDIRSKDLFGLGLFRYYLGVYNGEGRSAFSNGNTDFMYLGRFEVLPLGMFKDFSEGDFERLERPGLAIGVAYSFAPNARGERVNRSGSFADGGTADFHSVAADVTLKWVGLSLSAEFFLRDTKRNPGSATDEMGAAIAVEQARKGIGWFVQAGYLLPKMPIEFVGRFGQIIAGDDSKLSDQNEAGLAASYYFAQHPFKLQADAFRLWGDEFSEGTTRARVQVQVAF